MDAYFELTRAKILAKSVKADNGLGCIIWTGTKKSKSEYGVIKISPPGLKPIVRGVHRVIFMCSIKIFDIPREMDVSHICHNPLCVNIEHLTKEPHIINMHRIECANVNFCTRQHEPFCIFMPGKLYSYFWIAEMLTPFRGPLGRPAPSPPTGPPKLFVMYFILFAGLGLPYKKVT